jgi:predicted  nucleic acid-binding Zn-ribbon protein
MTKKQKIEQIETEISDLQRDKRSLVGELYETEDKHECYAIEMEIDEIEEKIKELRAQLLDIIE